MVKFLRQFHVTLPTPTVSYYIDVKGTTQEGITKEVVDATVKKLGVREGDISFEVTGNYGNTCIINNFIATTSIGFLEEKISTCSRQGWKFDNLS